jgi:sugar lactone lactonase YvrE
MYNARIRRVDANGIITTIAGNGAWGFNGEQGDAVTLSLYQPHSVAVDNSGNVYVVDTGNRRIRMITPGGIMKTIAGSGQSFFSGDGGPATSADLDHPNSVKFDGLGSMYVADSSNQRIRKITADGTISTIAGNGTAGYSGDGGVALSAALYEPGDVAVDNDGQVYIADTLNSRIRRIDTKGVISTVAGNGQFGFSGDGGLATLAQLAFPTGITLAPNGDLVIADRQNNRVRRVDSGGIITTVAGNGVGASGGDGGPALAASINWPSAVAFDSNGDLLICAQQDHRIRKVDAGGIISTIAGAGLGASPPLYGVPATQVFLDFPTGVAVDSGGNVFTNGTNQIQRINPSGILTILVNQEGELAWGPSGDGGPGVLASLTSDDVGVPGIAQNLAIGIDGGLYIPDANRIRRVGNPSTPAQIGLSTPYAFEFLNFDGNFGNYSVQAVTSNVGSGGMNWTATAATYSGGDWLSIAPSSGQAGDTISVYGAVSALPVGFYLGNVYVDVPNASNSPQPIEVQAIVGAPVVNTAQPVGQPGSGLIVGSLAAITGQLVQTLSQNIVAENEASWQLGGVSVIVNDVYAPIISLANVNGTQQLIFQVPVQSGIGQTSAQVYVLNGTAGYIAGLGTPSGVFNVPLTVTQAGGAPPTSIIATSGSNQSATVGTAFAIPLQATVMDFLGNPVPNIAVTFSTSNSGANGIFAGPSLSATVTTNNAGVATAPTFTANGTPGGPYDVVAVVSGATVPAIFSLINALPSVPVVSGVSPGSGSGMSQTFTFTFSDAAGWQSLGVQDILINSALDGRHACYIAYVPSGATTGSLYLVDDAGDAGGPYTGMVLPSSQTASNSQCTINGTGSSASGSGNTLTLTLAITFSSSFAGNKIFYLASADTGTGNSGWQTPGTWTVPGPPPTGPAVGGVSPARSTTLSQTYTFTFTDTNGWQDLAVLNILINTAIDGRHACYLAYVPSGANAGSLFLIDDSGDGGGPYTGFVLPGSGTAQNSQCMVGGAGGSVTATGNTLTLTLPITFTAGFAGNQVFFLAARSNTVSSDWQAVGSVTVP